MLQYHFNWKVLSAAAGITWWNFYFRLYQRTIRAAEVVNFLGHLLRHLPGKLLVVWDRSQTHRGRLVREFVARQRGRIDLEYLNRAQLYQSEPFELCDVGAHVLVIAPGLTSEARDYDLANILDTIEVRVGHSTVRNNEATRSAAAGWSPMKESISE